MASPLLLRSRASIRAVSVSLRSSKSSMHEPQLSPPSSCLRSPVTSSKRRGCCAPRLPALSSSRCLASMLPLHAVVASARLNSLLPAEPQSWGWVPQGRMPRWLLCPLCKCYNDISMLHDFRLPLGDFTVHTAYHGSIWHLNAFMTDLVVLCGSQEASAGDEVRQDVISR